MNTNQEACQTRGSAPSKSRTAVLASGAKRSSSATPPDVALPWAHFVALVMTDTVGAPGLDRSAARESG
ncbi:hypothetical protein [Methylobacterium radiotolerans]|uniref:hypothetical protein n=1 Tax=Methylobacterium radiotolerans TaxID=31998 RepID=UPI0011154941|nr:hypothetical protein [Methylobacterium radiotolerans]